MYDIDIKKLVELTSDDDKWRVQPIYHYANESIVPCILSSDCITFRLTRIDDFEDKSEGKTIEGYYQKALDSLHREGVLSDYLFDLFSQIKPSKRYGFPFSYGGRTEFASVIAIPYVICFSKEASNPEMFKNYLKGTNRGCSIEFARHSLSAQHLLVPQKSMKKTALSFGCWMYFTEKRMFVN